MKWWIREFKLQSFNFDFCANLPKLSDTFSPALPSYAEAVSVKVFGSVGLLLLFPKGRHYV
jgi:hypothetical protein